MFWNGLNFIVLSGYPAVCLEEFILAIVLARRTHGLAEVIVSRDFGWKDLQPWNWRPESYVAVPQLLLNSVMLLSTHPDREFRRRIRSVNHGFIELSEEEEDRVRVRASELLSELIEKHKDSPVERVFHTDIRALGECFVSPDDFGLYKLLEQSSFILEPDLWQDELHVLHAELAHQDRSNEQWTGLVNRFALF